MPTLTLKFKDKIIQEYTLDQGSAITIGRKDENDITIENLAVSGTHAKIDSVGDGYLLTDLQSKNGTFVNEQLVNSHYLKDGDEVVIGKHTFSFSHPEAAAQPDTAAAPDSMDKTMVMDTKKHREMLAKTQAASKNIGVLTFLAGGEGDLELTKKLIKIGKDSGSDIVVSGMTVGKTACTISHRPNGYFLSYVGGMAKPKVNDEAVKETVKLEEFDTIEIGSAKMQFVLK